ncbi:MAG: glycoside hydrolase family 25 protein [Bacteroidia bacterium]|nr:glycoside hydrolase family 25 protein [Bacteroidia bacterium]
MILCYGFLVFVSFQGYVHHHPLRAGFFLLLFFAFFIFLLIRFHRWRRNARTDQKEVPPIPSVPPRPLRRKSVFITGSVLFLVFMIIAGTVTYRVLLPKMQFRENQHASRSEYVFGIDVSHYQGTIAWDKVRQSHHPIAYVIIRATMGADGVDTQFKRNWKNARNHQYIRGAYHYYRPDEPAEQQFRNFASRVTLEPGDLPPILDVEKHSRYGNESLTRGVKKWLTMAEQHYGVTPVVYTGRTFYTEILQGSVENFPLWIASYSGKHKLQGVNWTFHQFSERIRVYGIRHYVDGNDFNGTLLELRAMCLDTDIH